MIHANRVKRVLADYLRTHFWNQAVAEARRFLVPSQWNHWDRKPLSGVIDFGHGQVRLPVPGKRYYVYWIPTEQLAGTPYQGGLGEWTSLDELMVANDCELRAYTAAGEMFYRPLIYWRHYARNRFLLVAIERNMAFRLASHEESLQQPILEIYLDSDVSPDIDTTHFHATSESIRYAAYQAALAADLTVVNGHRLNVTQPDQVQLGDYVEVLSDGNHFIEFQESPYSLESRHYLNTHTGKSMYLIHVPKTANPHGYAITVNNLDLYAINPVTGRGLLIPLADLGGRRIYQLTPQDFGLDFTVLDAWKDYLGVESLVLEVRIREHGRERIFPRDAFYCDLLYTHHDDQRIVELLTGVDVPAGLEFWHAQELEGSAYTDALLHYDWFSEAYPVDKYVQALGYYQAMSLVYGQIERVTVTGASSTLLVDVPPAMTGAAVTPQVFRNGQKLLQTELSWSYNSGTGKLSITWTAGTFQPDDQVVVQHHETTTQRSYRLSPASGNRTFQLIGTPNTMAFYQRVAVTPVSGIVGTASVGYNLVTPADLDITVVWSGATEITVTFPATLDGEVFAVQPLVGDYRFTSWDASTGVLVVTPTTPVYDGVNPSAAIGTDPILGDFAVMAYLNGRTLTDHVDFVTIPLVAGGTFCFREIALQNLEFLTADTNTLEVYCQRGQAGGTSYGHPTTDNPTGLDELFVWYPKLTMAYSDGLVLFGGTLNLTGQFVADMPSGAYGAVSGARTVIPGYIHALFPAEWRVFDDNRLSVLRNYLRSRPAPWKLVAIPKTHDIYSIYLAQVIHTIRTATSGLAADAPIDTTALATTAKATWQWLLTYDLVYSSRINSRFVDFFPTWQRLPLLNRAAYNLIQSITHELDVIDRDTDRRLFL